MSYQYRYGGCLLGKEEVAAINKVLKRNYWPLESEGEKMEAEAAKYLGMKHGILANSGSSAGLLALSALELSKGSEVIIPATTFPTIFGIILQCGLVPVVVDSKVGTYNLDPDELEQAISEKTKAVICVHAVGNPCDMPKIMKIAKKHNLYVLEDNCLAEGTLVKTERGDIPIEEVRVGDMAMTRKGYRQVLRVLPRGEKDVITQFGITATPDHPFRTKRGNVPFAQLQPSDILYTWNQMSSSIEETSITAIRNQNTETNESIGTALIKDRGISIAMSTRMQMARFLRECLSTIKTIIPSITSFPTLKLSPPKNTRSFISKSQVDWIQLIETWTKPVMVHAGGTSQNRGMRGMLYTTNGYGQFGRSILRFASFAVASTRRTGLFTRNTAVKNANGRVKVYDLEVDDAHEFFANGVLVKNCDGWGGNIGKKKVGSFGHVSFTSFHAAHIVAMGQGGGVFTNDKELARRVRMYRDWGRQSDIPRRTNGKKWPTLPEDYDARFIYEKIGYNLSPLELQAAMGRVQLKKTEKIKALRKRNYEYLYKELSKFPDLIMPKTVEGADPCWFSFPLSTWGPRGPLVAFLEKNGVETRSMFAGNITVHPMCANIEWRQGTPLDEANIILKQSFWVPLHPRYTPKDLKGMVDVFRRFYDKA